jgi:hypothetical protein
MLRLAAAVALVAWVLASPVAHAESPPPDAVSFAARVGWAYGLGAELEYRPEHWGVGVSGGYVPGYGPGGYLSGQWGLHPLDTSGVVAEAGLFYGEPSPLRAAPAGLGAYAMGGYALVPTGRLSLRLVLGGGVPFAAVDGHPSFEFLAKLTAGWVF